MVLLTRAALIVVPDDLPDIRILGLHWPEFQLRSAMGAGAQHIVLVATRITGPVLRAIDRARGEGVSATLVRSAAEAGDLFHPDETVLLMSGSAIVTPAQLRTLIEVSGPALLCTDEVAYEMIDASDRWVGIARIDGAQVRATAASVGEWDMASMLLRQAVRAGAVRIAVGNNVINAVRPGASRLAAARSIGVLQASDTGWAQFWIVAPVARAVASLAADVLPLAARFGGYLAILLFAGAPVAAWIFAGSLGCLVLLLGLIVADIANRAASATNTRVRLQRWLWLLACLSGIACLGAMTLPPGTDRGPSVLASVLIVLQAVAMRLPFDPSVARWRADLPGLAIGISIGALFGPPGIFLALGVATAHVIAGMAWLQNRLSGALTPSR